MTNQFDLTNRTAIVTGSAQGMGRAMAIALAEAGANLVLLDRNAAGIEATAHTIRQLGRKAEPIEGDVTDTDHIDRVFAAVDRAFGRVDILGNVAGEAKAGAAEDMTLADIRTTFHNLVISRYYTCQLAGRRMLAQGKGSIISIGSIAGSFHHWLEGRGPRSCLMNMVDDATSTTEARLEKGTHVIDIGDCSEAIKIPFGGKMCLLPALA